VREPAKLGVVRRASDRIDQAVASLADPPIAIGGQRIARVAIGVLRERELAPGLERFAVLAFTREVDGVRRLAACRLKQFLGAGLSNAALATLNRQHPNVCMLKGEAPAHVIERLVADTEGMYRVFNGRGGMELPECLRAGCVGMIPAPECFDVQVAVYEAMRRETPEGDVEAERRYREILPLIVFMMSSVETFVCYGKRVVARRLGIEHVFDRAPCQRPTEFGLLTAERLASALPPL